MTTRDDLVNRMRERTCRLGASPEQILSFMDGIKPLLNETISALEAANAEIAGLKVELNGAIDRSKLLLDAKNHWMDRALTVERQLAEETERCARSVINKIAEVAKAVGWQAGVGASETAGMIVSCLAANPSEIERFMSEGSELIVDGTIAAHKGDLTFHRSADGKVTTPQELRSSMTVRDMQQYAIRGGAK